MISDTNWEKKKLKDLCIKIGSGATPSGGKENYKTSGISLIRSQNIYNHTFLYNGLAYIDDEQAKKLNNVDVQQNDVLLNITGDSVCRCCIVPSEVLPARVNQHVAILRADKSKLDPSFLKSYLTNELMQNFMLSLAQTGGTRAALTKGMIEEFEILVPDLREQARISKILCSLDKKIELINGINRNLEELAQALFKRWFVDFEFPNEIGEPYKSSGGDFEESDLGLIPINWSIKSIYELAKYINGASFKANEIGGIGVPIIKISELKGGITSQTKHYQASDKDDKYYIGNGDILFSWSGNPETSIDTFIWFRGRGILNQHIFKVVPNSEKDKGYVYTLLKYTKSTFTQIASGKQTTGLGHVTVKDLQRLKVAFPDKNTLSSFSEIINPIIEQIYNNDRESELLNYIRTTFLPKLMSGEIRVPLDQEYTQDIDLPMVAEHSKKYNAH